MAGMRSELAVLRRQLAVVNQKYAQANAGYKQASSQLAALTQQDQQLQAQLANAQARTNAAQEAREKTERRLKTEEQALNSKAVNAKELARNLDTSKNKLRKSEVQRTTLQNRVQQLKVELQAVQGRPNRLEAHAPTLRQSQLAAEPEQSSGARAASIKPLVPPPARKPKPVRAPRAENNVSGALKHVERLLASTGVDIKRLLHGLHNAPAEGGPYIALNDPRAKALDRRRVEDLKRLAKILPLASPLKHYTIGSPFGPRIDPINHRAAFHPGVDLEAPYKSTVYSTGAGTVLFTGWIRGYGRVVEINHGHGIMTRYAHLHRILVAKGERVGVHKPIGELGDTGRSTGPHLHYEIHVDGVVVNPAKFLQAGKDVVQVSEHR